MIPKLYDKTGQTLLGELTSCIDCYVEEERNGTFCLTMTYPITDDLHHDLIYDNIIRCRANDEQLDEPFRIYHTERIIKGTISIKALHQSFDLAYDYVSNISFENQSCEYALNTLFRESQFSKDYKGHSDIVNAQDFTATSKNIWEAIVGSSGSIIDTYGVGAEIKRDNKDIYVYNNRGTDRGVCIEYSVNMMDEALQVDTSELVTAMIGFATYMDEEGEQQVVETSLIRSSLVDSYAHPFILRKDFTDRFEQDTIPTVQDLETLVNKEFTINHVDVPKCSYVIDFVPLSKCAGYEDIQDEIHLCDTVSIKDYRYNIDTKAKVIKYTYNVLLERYDSMELGDPRNTLADIIAGSGIKGEKGDPGMPGEKGEDGSIGDFPDSLPDAPVVTLRAGLATIQVDWTYESQVYYNYEVYASTTQGFTPNQFDLIYSGQASSYLHSVSANTTWYYRVRALNTHGNSTAFSEEVSATPGVIDEDTVWIEKGAIGDAMIGELRLDRGWVGQLEGYWIDARNLTVTDGNGNRTLDIDSYGNVKLDVASLKISASNVATENYADQAAGTAEQNAITSANNNLNNKLSSYYSKTQVDSKFELLEDEITLNVTQEQIEEAVNSLRVGGTNLLVNSGPQDLTGITGYNGTLTLVSCASAPYGYAVRCTTNGSNNIFGVTYPTYSLNEIVDGEEYTISGWARAYSSNTGTIGSSLMGLSDIELTTEFEYFTYTSKMDKTASTATNNFLRSSKGTTSGMWIEVHSMKLERGNFATAWSPSPRDIEGDLKTLTERVSSAELKITPDAITSTVTSSTTWETQTTNITNANTNATNALNKANTNATNITSLTTRVSTAEQKITDSAIISKVTSSTEWKTQTTNITNATNKANSNATSITNLTTRVASAEQKITDSAIISKVTSSSEWKTQTNNISSATTTANNANTNATNAVNKANTNATNISNLASRVSSAELKITSSAIISTVTSSSQWSTQTTNITNATTKANNATTTANNAMTQANTNATNISTVTSSVTQLSNKFAWIVSSGTSQSNMTLTDKMYSLISANVTIKASNINLQGYVTANSGFKIDTSGNMTAMNATIHGAITSDTIMYANGGIYTKQDIRGTGTGSAAGLTVVTGTGNLAVRTENSSYSVYIQPANGEAKVTYPSQPTNYADLRLNKLVAHGQIYSHADVRGAEVYANGVKLTSDRAKKRDIENYTEDALYEICTTPVRTYHLEGDLDEEMKRIGIILQEAPMNAVDLRGEGVDLYQMCAMMWKAIQQLNEMKENK